VSKNNRVSAGVAEILGVLSKGREGREAKRAKTKRIRVNSQSVVVHT
jgi:hypothetical protein